MDDSYVEKRGCPLSSPSSFVGQNHNIACHSLQCSNSPQHEQSDLVPPKGPTKSSLRITDSERARYL
eukprot:scaffold1914_cov132-Skeletonema_dohrnii-CCMP3373.AAC.2